MNAAEKIVYHAVKRFPRVKYALRDTYQSLFDLVPVARKTAAYPITVRKGYFFGFHDKTPYSADDSRLLAGRFDIPLRMPLADDTLEVGCFDGPDHTEWHPVGRSLAWNWHQGCMLQWRGATPEIVYNDFESGALVARCHNTETLSIRTIDVPVGAVSPDGRHGLSYSFPRVNRYMPGYGYVNGRDPTADQPAPADSGLSAVDLETGAKNFLFSIEDIVGVDPTASMQGASHYFSHCLFSPSNRRFVFMHRWVKDDVRRRWSRLLSADLDGGNLHIFPTEEMVSHIGWRDDEHILAYCRVAGAGDRYVLFRDRHPNQFLVVGEDTFDSDGHPSFAPGGRWFVTDTYPNRYRLASLYLYDCGENRGYEIARLKADRKFASRDLRRHWTCDLHPRWNRAGTVLCFDATFTGERALCTMPLGDDLQGARPKTIA